MSATGPAGSTFASLKLMSTPCHRDWRPIESQRLTSVKVDDSSSLRLDGTPRQTNGGVLLLAPGRAAGQRVSDADVNVDARIHRDDQTAARWCLRRSRTRRLHGRCSPPNP